MQDPENDLIAAIATPSGQGGIGILRLSGPRSWRMGQTLFKPAHPYGPQGPRARRMVFGQALDPQTGQALDQVLAVFFKGPASYTGEDAMELQGHGGQAVMHRLLEAALANGARLAQPGEFTKRAYLNGRLDLAQAESVAELVAAASQGEARLALASLAGGLSRALAGVRRALLAAAAGLEAAIDFGDEMDAGELPGAETIHAGAVEPLQTLLAARDRWAAYRDGATVVLAGRPNVGKSSLFNALLGRERAIVASRPGTTRDTLEEVALLNGVTCRLVDTAGLGQATDELDGLGQDRARQSLAGAQLCLVVLDGSAPLGNEDHEVLALTAGRPRIIAVNKADIKPAWRWCELDGDAVYCVSVSAVENYGLDRLAREAAYALTGEDAPPACDQAVANKRQAQALARCLAAAQRAAQGLTSLRPALELVSLDLQEALSALGEVDGQGAPDQVIDTIFDQFCLGK